MVSVSLFLIFYFMLTLSRLLYMQAGVYVCVCVRVLYVCVGAFVYVCARV